MQNGNVMQLYLVLYQVNLKRLLNRILLFFTIIDLFEAHSKRSALSSKAGMTGKPLNEILKRGS